MLMFARFVALLVGSVFGLLLLMYSMLLLAPGGNGPTKGNDGLGFWWSLSGIAMAVCFWFYRRVQRVELERQQRRDEAEFADAARYSRFTAEGRPLALGLGMFGAIAMFGIGLKLAIDKSHWPMAGLAGLLLLFFLLAGLEICRQLLRPGPMLTIDGRGIEHAMYGLIPWEDIIGLCLQQTDTRYSRISNLMLGVRAPQRYRARTPWLHRLQKRAWRRRPPAFGTLPIGLNTLNQKPALIHQIATILQSRAATPLLAQWHPAMTEQQVRTLLDMQSLADDLHGIPGDAVPEQMEAIMARMSALGPDIDRAARDSLDSAKRARRNAIWMTVGGMVLFALLLALRLQG